MAELRLPNPPNTSFVRGGQHEASMVGSDLWLDCHHDCSLGRACNHVGPLHIPYPYKYPYTGRPVFPDVFVLTLAALYLVQLLDTRFQRLSIGRRCLILFLLLATVKGALFRAAFMNIMNSTSIIYSIVQALPNLIALAVTAAFVVFSAAYPKKGWTRWFLALVISVFVFFVWDPFLNLAFSRLLASIAWMSGPSLYDPPYHYHILIPAYLSFLEPVIASFFMASLVWKNLPHQFPFVLESLRYWF